MLTCIFTRCTFVHMEYQTISKTFRQLIVWREAHQLTLMVYRATQSFPTDERFGIISQLRRATSSIGAQIAEGSQMPSKQHRKLYYDRSYASAAEVDNFLELSKDLGYLATDLYKNLLAQLNRVSFLLSRLSQSQQTSLTQRTPPTKPTQP